MSAILTPGDHRAYTLKPHWAHAIAHLGKRCENRMGPIPRGLVGKRVAIHAGAWTSIERVAWLDEIDTAFPGTKAERRKLCGGSLAPEGLSAAQQGRPARPGVMRCSSVVATAVLGRSICSHHADRTGWREWGMWDWPVWWRLDDVRTLTCPVPIKRGAQGPWRLTPEQVEAINAQGGGL